MPSIPAASSGALWHGLVKFANNLEITLSFHEFLPLGQILFPEAGIVRPIAPIINLKAMERFSSNPVAIIKA